MSENNKYGTIINEKFSDFSFQDMDNTWLDMKNILDREMPQNKKRRPLLWLNWYTGISLFLVASSIVGLVIFGYLYSSETVSQNTSANNIQATEKIQNNIQAPENNKNVTVSTPSGQASEKNTGTRKVETSPAKTESLVNTTTEQVNTTTSGRQTKMVNQKTDKNVENLSSSTNNQTVNTTINNRSSKELSTTAADKTTEKKRDFSSNQTAKKSFNHNSGRKDLIKENASTELVFSKTEHLRSGLPLMMSERNGISNHRNINIEVSDKNVLHNLIQMNDSASTAANDSSLQAAAKRQKKNIGKGWVFGASINYNLPVSKQEMSTVNMNGTTSRLIDFLPSVYAQYHFNKQWYVESSFQFTSPQYISNHKLASVTKDVNPNKKEENAIWLNKLYYLNIPVSVHYKVIPNLTVGSGVQYSYLRRSIFADELATWEKQGNGWNKTASQKSIAVKSNAAVKRQNADRGNGNGGGGTPPPPTTPVSIVDTAAQTLNSSDLRLLFDVNYNMKRVNMGISFQLGLNNYINTQSGNYVLPVKDRNQALQLYLRYDLFDKRKK